jgi:hypothetical protein
MRLPLFLQLAALIFLGLVGYIGILYYQECRTEAELRALNRQLQYARTAAAIDAAADHIEWCMAQGHRGNGC